MNIDKLSDLQEIPIWVTWVTEAKGKGVTKIPKNPRTGRNAQVPTNPKTYGTHAAATERWDIIRKKDPDAVGGHGVVLSELPNGVRLVGIDLDSCRDLSGIGLIDQWADDVIRRFNTYAELSPSGTGVKLYFLMTLEDFTKLQSLLKHKTRMTFARPGKHQELAIDTARFYAVTGNKLTRSPTEFRLVPFADVEWIIKDAGPRYLKDKPPPRVKPNAKGNGQSNSNWAEAYADQDNKRDYTRSGDAYRFMQDCHGKGLSKEEAFAAILADETTTGEWAREKGVVKNNRELERAWENSKPTSSSSSDRAWPELNPDALYGLPGKIVATISPHSEGDPVALLMQLLVWVGNALGRGVHIVREGNKHFTNLNALLVGATAKARKGTSAKRIEQLMNTVVPEYVRMRIKSGISSGEGIIWAIRDEVTKLNKKGEEEIEVHAVEDKRLLIQEGEFTQALQAMKREGNTASTIIRNAWDGKPLASLIKHSQGVCAEPHVSIMAHITEYELRMQMDVTSILNGFANRILFTCVRRTQFLPHGGDDLKQSVIEALGEELEVVYKEFGPRLPKQIDYMNMDSKAEFAPMVEITMDAEARDLWEKVYRGLSEGLPGMLGSITARAEAQTLRLALLYAVLDLSHQIKSAHLKAALALWKYCEDSARYIYGDTLGDPIADEIERALRVHGELTRTEIHDLFDRNQSKERINAALELLAKHGRARFEMRAKKGSKAGRKGEVWSIKGN